MLNIFYYFVGIVIVLMSITLALHAILTKKEPSLAIMWALTCLWLPVFGVIFYVLFGINRIHFHARRHSSAKSNKTLPNAAQDDTIYTLSDIDDSAGVVARTGFAMTHNPLLAGQNITPLFNGKEAYPSMLAAIEKAKKSIWLATYIFNNDKIGKIFVEALRGARERGVEVRVLIDGIGVLQSFPTIKYRLKKAKIKFATFNAPRILPPQLFINLRNHQKILIIDGEFAWTGGMNICDINLTPSRHTCQDVHFMIEGSVLREFQRIFAQNWFYAAEEYLDILSAPKKVKGSVLMRTVMSGPHESENILESILLGVISSAQKRIWFMTPYFLPAQTMISALQSAALRGVDVRIVIPAKSDHIITHWALFRGIEGLLRYGIKIFFQPPPFNHSKILIIDDFYAHIGSANMDRRSLELNFEMTLEVFDIEFTRTMSEHFTNILSRSAPYTLSRFKNRSLPVKLRDSLCWILSPYL